MRVNNDDHIAISDHLGRYCWAVDDGEEEAWVALWTEDGTFTGIAPEPVVGREALKSVPRMAMEQSGGKMRHLFGSLFIEYGDSQDIAIAKYYNFVTNWIDGPSLTCMALCTVTLVRNGEGWLVQRNDTTLLM